MIKQEELFIPCLYNDGEGAICASGVGGSGNCSIGYGTLIHYGPCDGTDPSEDPYHGRNIDNEEATKLLLAFVATLEQTIRDQVTIQLSQNQFDALVIFLYNAGQNALVAYGILEPLNNGDFETVYKIMREIVYDSDGVYQQGLANRREEEIRLFRDGIYRTNP